MQILNPTLLLLMIPAAAGLYLLARRSYARHRYAHLMVRLLACGAMILAAAGVEIRRPDYAAERFFLLDMSASTGLQAGQWLDQIQQAARRFHPHDRMTVIAFGREPLVEFGPATPADFSLSEIGASVDASATNLEAALGMVRSLHREGSPAQVVLISDGNETTGRVSREAVSLAAEGIEVYCVPAGRTVQDARVRFVEHPQMVRPDQSFAVTVEVAGEGAAEISVRTDEGVAAGGRLLVDGRKLWRCDLSLAKPGLHTIAATVASPGDGIPQNNTCTAAVWVRGAATLLWIADGPSALAAAAGQAGMVVDTIDAAHLPPEAAGLNAYDALVIEDVCAARFDDRSLGALTTYVQSMGGGLIMLGGACAFGPGGYIDSPIEPLLPVECDALEEKSKPMSLAVVIDRSGSMGEAVRRRTKLSYAQEGVLHVLRKLNEADRMAVIAFGSSADVIRPLGTVQDAAEVERRVTALDAHGSTDLNAALEAALEQMANAGEDDTSHVILLSDGLSKDVKPDWPAQFAAAGVTVSVVATGEAVNQTLLEALAEGTGGRYYAVDSIETIPQIFSQEARPSTGKLLRASEAGFPAELAASPLSDRLGAPPAVGQYVLVKARDRSEVAITVDAGKPLLAAWRTGVGRSVAFAAPAGVFTGWADAGAMWARAIAWAARPPGDPQTTASVIVDGETAHVEVAAPEAGHSDLRAIVVNPDGARTERRLHQAAAGLYAASFSIERPGVYPVTIVERNDDGDIVRTRAAAVLSYSSEYARVGIDRATLAGISSATAGGMLADLASLPPPPEGQAPAFVNVGWLPALLALLLFLLGLAIT